MVDFCSNVSVTEVLAKLVCRWLVKCEFNVDYAATSLLELAPSGLLVQECTVNLCLTNILRSQAEIGA